MSSHGPDHPGYPSDGGGGVASVCEHFQLDLSCLMDGELDEAAAGRAMVHLEACGDCRDFFEDTRDCLRMHLDVSDPDRLIARLSTLTGTDLAQEAEAIGLVQRLATIFYQLGKAYLLSAVDPNYKTRVFESAVPVEAAQTQGRGFVDGVLNSGRPGGQVDWVHARHMLNGRLKEIEEPIEKARRLLDEAIASDPSHEEARLYLAYLHAHEGKTLKAAEEFRDIFRTALTPSNRGHAATQLGVLYDREEEFRKALACFRWVSISGLADEDERFFFARFDIGLEYALLGDMERSLDTFRALLDRYPDRVPDVAMLFSNSKNLQAAVESQPGFAEALLEQCPELFRAPGHRDRSLRRR